MTTRKVVLIVAGVVAALGLLVALFVGSIVGVVFYSIGSSEAAETAKTFLRTNERLKQDIGEVRDFGYFPSGQIKTHGAAGNASLTLKTIGEKKTVSATVLMAYRSGRDWRVVDAYYDNEAGERVALTSTFDDPAAARYGDPVTKTNAPAPFAGFDEDGFKADVLESARPVLVVLGSPSSLDSVELEKTLDQIAPKYERSIALVRYNLSEQPVALQRLNARTVPTVIVYTGGEERERRAGKISRDELAALLDRYAGE
jgi:thioredoxin 1